MRTLRPPEFRVALLATVLAAAIGPVAAQQPDSAVRPLAPKFGSGLAWVEPLPLSPRELAKLLSGVSELDLRDSAIVALTQHFLEARQAASAAAEADAPDSWVTSIGGQQVGLDQRWIYLGPIKLPSTLLALLPLNLQANPTEYAAFRKREAMREDILTAGWRSANLAELKEAVRRLRQEREAEREFEKNRRTAPPVEGTPP